MLLNSTICSNLQLYRIESKSKSITQKENQPKASDSKDSIEDLNQFKKEQDKKKRLRQQISAQQSLSQKHFKLERTIEQLKQQNNRLQEELKTLKIQNVELRNSKTQEIKDIHKKYNQQMIQEKLQFEGRLRKIKNQNELLVKANQQLGDQVESFNKKLKFELEEVQYTVKLQNYKIRELEARLEEQKLIYEQAIINLQKLYEKSQKEVKMAGCKIKKLQKQIEAQQNTKFTSSEEMNKVDLNRILNDSLEMTGQKPIQIRSYIREQRCDPQTSFQFGSDLSLAN